MDPPSSSFGCPFLAARQGRIAPSTSSSSLNSDIYNNNSESDSISESVACSTGSPSSNSGALRIGASSSSMATGAHAGINDGRTASGVFQAWNLRRPDVHTQQLKLTRRQLRRLERSWSLEEVACHNTATDGWIAVNGRVYDITEHIVHHPGWEGAGISTVLSILAHLGTDCSKEFEEIHRPWPVAWRQLAAYDIGALE